MRDLRYGPLDSDFVANPYPVRPVFFDEPARQWVISRYPDVNALLRDRRGRASRTSTWRPTRSSANGLPAGM